MIDQTERAQASRALLIGHATAYPHLQEKDVLKLIFQSAFGCEHLVQDADSTCERIRREAEETKEDREWRIERLGEAYSRVHLSCLHGGLSCRTLSRLFCLSAVKEEKGAERAEELLDAAQALVEEGLLPFDAQRWREEVDRWRAAGYPALRHSEGFRAEYRPAYRVIARRYADYLPLFAEIDRRIGEKPIVIALEGGSASGKTTLAALLQRVYDCRVIHMDDFFLRPAQRTPERLSQVGGNLDRERFAEEVLPALIDRRDAQYRRFDCGTQTLSEVICAPTRPLTVVEGVYSTHPAFGRYYDASVFLDIDPALQRERILARNGPSLAKRFFGEWIPMENRYFDRTDLKKRVDLVLDTSDGDTKRDGVI